MRIIIAFFVLGIVILFHELGHFLLAKANGVKVLEFAIGMGPKLFSFHRGGTDYAIRVLPFGGSCSMLGEDTETEAHTEGSFNDAAIWRRALIVAAGPCFNFIMALVCSMILVGALGADEARVVEVPVESPAAEAGLEVGDLILKYDGNGIANASEMYIDLMLSDIPTDRVELVVKKDGKKETIQFTPQTEKRYVLGFYYQDIPDGDGVQITRLAKNSPMKEAGMGTGDILTSLNGEPIHSVDEMQTYLDAHPMDGTPMDLTYLRGEDVQEIKGLVPYEETTASLGFAFNLAREKQGFFGWLKYSFAEVRYWIHVVLKSLASLFNGTFSINDMSGPVGIIGTIGDAYEEARPMGIWITILTLLNLITLLSANLGVMNLIPFPALDGGRLLLFAIEAIRRKPTDRKLEGRINYVGLMVLLAFMVYISIHDILKLI